MSFKTRDGIKVFTRVDWRARPAKGALAPLGKLRTLVYHHGGPVGGPRWTFNAAAETCRSWQNFHMDSHGWSDIGYHLLMDGRGRLYLGRPANKLGAHVLAENTGRIGLNYMQDGRRSGLTVFQKRTTRKLFARAHGRLGLPALKDLANGPPGVAVLGHREVPGQATECPGDLIAADVHSIIKEFLK